MNEQHPAKLLLDVKEVAELLGCGRSHIYGYVMRGELKSFKLGRRRKIAIESVLDFIQKQRAEAEDASGW